MHEVGVPIIMGECSNLQDLFVRMYPDCLALFRTILYSRQVGVQFYFVYCFTEYFFVCETLLNNANS